MCHSALSAQVRDALFDSDFAANAGALLLPVPVLLAALLAMRRILP